MSQVITNAFARYWQDCLTDEVPVVLDAFVLANIPGLDPDGEISPDDGLPPEAQIVYRQAVDQRGRINLDAVAYTIVMDTSVGDFEFNAMYLINTESNLVGMIVHKGLEAKLKTDETTGQTGNSLVKSMLMEYDRASLATVTTVDASTWQIDYAARLAGMDEDMRRLALSLYGPAWFEGDGFLVTNNAGVYHVHPGEAVVGGLLAVLSDDQIVTPDALPMGVWVDVYRAGSLLDAWVNHITLTLSVDMTDYVDSNGYQHHVAAVAIVNADGSVTDVRHKRTIELTGDVAGKGILDAAQGVTIAVEIKDGSHRHPWKELDNVPETASRWPVWNEVADKPDTSTRWPAWGEVTGKPATMPPSDHTHPGSLPSPISLAKEDLNTIVTPGHYAQHMTANASAGQHYPESLAGSLIVTSGAGVQQRYHVYNTSSIWTRALYTGSAWTPWAKEYNTLNRPTPTWAEVSGKPATMPPSAHTHTAAQANHDIVAAGWGQVGTYMLAAVLSSSAIPGLAHNIAGTHLRASGCYEWSYGGSALPGTWKQLGNLANANTDDRLDDRTTLFIRVA